MGGSEDEIETEAVFNRTQNPRVGGDFNPIANETGDLTAKRVRLIGNVPVTLSVVRVGISRPLLIGSRVSSMARVAILGGWKLLVDLGDAFESRLRLRFVN